MAPFVDAIDVSFSHKQADGTFVYKGMVDPKWVVLAVPHGGYILSIILNAACKFQENSNHVDPAHLSSYFLRPSSIGEYEVHVKPLKSGKTLTHLTATLIQKNQVNVMATFVFARLSALPEPTLPTPNNLTLVPPSQNARRIPMTVPPNKSLYIPPFERYGYKEYFDWKRDPTINDRNVKPHPSDEISPAGQGGLQYGVWLELINPKDTISAKTIPFFADMFMSPPQMLPRDQRPSSAWFPTICLSIEFKVKISPEVLKSFHTHKLGVYTLSRFMHEGRHDVYQEIWTCPQDKDAENDNNWREKQHIIAISNQYAMVVPAEINLRNSKL